MADKTRPTHEQIKLKTRLLRRIEALDLEGYFDPEDTQSSTWPFWMLTWDFEHRGQTYSITVECAWDADSYKMARLHDVRVHGLTYDYDARFLDARFLEAFASEWNRARKLVNDEYAA